MDFRVDEDQSRVKNLIRSFCTKEVDVKELLSILRSHASASSIEEIRKTYPYRLQERLHEIGLRQLAVPQEYGGTAPYRGSNVLLTIAAEEMGYWGGPVVGLVMIPWIFLKAVANNRTVSQDQKEWIFSKFVADPHFIIAASVSEGDSATDIHLPYDEGMGKVLKVRAFREQGRWVIDGTKAYCSGGAVASYIMVATRTEENLPVSKACTFFWVPTNDPNIRLNPHHMAITDFGGNCLVVLNGVRVTEDHMLGERGRGFTIIQSFFNAHLPGIAGLVGAMRRIFEHMQAYAKERIGGGKPIKEHSGLASKLGEIAAQIEACRSLMYRAAWEIDQAEENGLPPDNLFWFASTYGYCKRAFMHFCEVATCVYGGMALSVDFPLFSFLLQSFYVQAAGLTREIDFMIAARDYEKKYNFGF